MDILQLINLVAEQAPDWADTKKIANSNFVTSLVGAFAGAAGGALAAQRIAERAKQKEFLLQQIGSSNAAIELAFGMCNSFLNIKEQHTKPLKDKHDHHKATIAARRQGVQQDQIRAQAQIELGQIDLRILTPVPVSYTALETKIFEKLSVKGRARPMTAVLIQSIHGLESVMTARNAFITDFKVADLTADQRARLLFGLADNNGNIDSTYPDLVEGMSSQADDCIFFSRTLCKDLVDYGEGVRKQFIRRFRGECPTVSKPDFKKAEDKGLMPADAKYEDWITGYPKKEPQKPLLQRAWEWLSRRSRVLLERVINTARQIGARLRP